MARKSKSSGIAAAEMRLFSLLHSAYTRVLAAGHDLESGAHTSSSQRSQWPFRIFVILGAVAEACDSACEPNVRVYTPLAESTTACA